jgi:hypothetical protein
MVASPTEIPEEPVFLFFIGIQESLYCRHKLLNRRRDLLSVEIRSFDVAVVTGLPSLVQFGHQIVHCRKAVLLGERCGSVGLRPVRSLDVNTQQPRGGHDGSLEGVQAVVTHVRPINGVPRGDLHALKVRSGKFKLLPWA